MAKVPGAAPGVRITSTRPGHDGGNDEKIISNAKKFGRNITCFFILPNPKYKITKIPNDLILDQKINESLAIRKKNPDPKQKIIFLKNIFFSLKNSKIKNLLCKVDLANRSC
jgi:hypothetical protein